MKQSDIPSAQAVVLHCRAWGIRDVVISPGSRNAPLTISFTENPFFKCYALVDERCAAFFALGIAMHQRRPAVLVCTSGSALLNYYPAIAEAFYSHIPLVVVSADRPPYKIDVGDGQTIRQENIFKSHIAYSANLKLDVNHATDRIKRYAPELVLQSQSEIQEFNENELGKALTAVFEKKLPVHINVPFEEPLYDTIERDQTVEMVANNARPEGADLMNINEAKELWNSSKRKMVLVGVNYPNNVEKEVLHALANDPTVLVFTETTSNLYHPNFFPSIDSIVFPIEKSENQENLFKRLQPEILLTFGGMVVSKKIKAFLRLYRPEYHWHVGEHDANNTFFSLSFHFKMEPNEFIKVLISENVGLQSDYFRYWNAVKLAYEKKRIEYISKIPFSDFWVFGNVLGAIPKGYQVHLANSSTVRYAQLFDMDPSFEVFCNRGTSGIEGSTSTAIGASVHNASPTVLVTGDLSFLYDSNALWNEYIRSDFRIVIVNNGGGGIFRILPGKEESLNFSTYFETRHGLSAKKISEQYNFEYIVANDKKELVTGLETFFETSARPRILEVFTPTDINDGILLDYFDFIS